MTPSTAQLSSECQDWGLEPSTTHLLAERELGPILHGGTATRSVFEAVKREVLFCFSLQMGGLRTRNLLPPGSPSPPHLPGCAGLGWPGISRDSSPGTTSFLCREPSGGQQADPRGGCPRSAGSEDMGSGILLREPEVRMQETKVKLRRLQTPVAAFCLLWSGSCAQSGPSPSAWGGASPGLKFAGCPRF